MTSCEQYSILGGLRHLSYTMYVKKLSSKRRGLGWSGLLFLVILTGCAHVKTEHCEIRTFGVAEASCYVEGEYVSVETKGLSGSFSDALIAIFPFIAGWF